ncbi:MAG: ribbon-helix-helix protein, CopG family [Propionibacterium sp.]|nr:ribbon-helix-helix protein, CopG family [Propionibacterium sp.]
MNPDVTTGVEGIGEAELAGLIEEAAAGYDLASARVEPNPHHVAGRVVPPDLLAEIDARARRDGRSPDDVVRDALTQFLHSA